MCALLIALPQFNGPLDLLLSLIQKRRLDVTALSLAAVADQYLEQVLAREGELEALSEFLVLGSQLLVIKSRALLPEPDSSSCEEDPAEELRRRLAEYQVLRVAAQWLAEQEQSARRMWPGRGEPLTLSEDTPLAPVSAARLARLAALGRVQSMQDAPSLAAPNRPALRERVALLLQAVSRDVWTPLSELLGGDVPTAVATFLAVLLLVRRGVVEIQQASAYVSVELRRTAVDSAVLSGLDEWA